MKTIEAKIIKKVSRYLVLSKEFEKKESDLFEERAVEQSSFTNGGTGCITVGMDYINNTISYGNIVTESKTRSQVILLEAQLEASRSDRYDEYKKLQSSLSEYFEALEKVNK
jgi:hypothetical protein